MKIVRILSFFMAIVCILGVSSFGVTAQNAEFELTGEDALENRVGFSESVLSKYVDFEEFRSYLKEQLLECNEKIDISSYNIPSDAEDFMGAVSTLVFYEMYDVFHVDSFKLWKNSTKFVYFEFFYTCTKEEIAVYESELYSAVEEMVTDVKGNDALTEAEKALLLHDRLALACEYDYTYTNRDAYDALVTGSAVCEGYSKAYGLLLTEVGIKNEVTVSNTLYHSWNIVYLDGVSYHVDVTWDDLAWKSGDRGVAGLVEHDNFLLSTDGIYASGHEATDYTTSPSDTTYDNYFWKNSKSAFVLLNGEMYYIDNESAELKRYGDGAVLCSVKSRWDAGENSYWTNNYSRLATDGKNLFYSVSNGIYKYDVEKNTSELVFAPELSGYCRIYGFEYKDGYFVCDINNAPPYGNGTNLYQEKYLYSSEENKELTLMDGSELYVDGSYIMGVRNETTAQQLLGEFLNEGAQVCDADGVVLGEADICKTGCVVKLEGASSLEIVIWGDVDGNGKVDSTDYLRIKSAFLGKYVIEGVYFKSADVTVDGVLDSSDYLRIKSVFLGTFSFYS